MDHGGEAARPTTVESTDLGMNGAVQGGEANMSTGTFHGQLGAAAAARRAGIDGFQPSAAAYHDSTAFARQVRSVPVAVRHREPAPGVAYADIRRQPGPPVGVLLVVSLQHRPGARLGIVLADLLPGGAGAVYSGDYALQPRSGAGGGEVLVFVGLLPDGVDAVYDDYGYDAWQPSPGAGRGEVFNGPLPNGLGAVFDNSGNFVQQTVPGTKRADGIAGYDGAAYNHFGMVAEHLRRLSFRSPELEPALWL